MNTPSQAPLFWRALAAVGLCTITPPVEREPKDGDAPTMRFDRVSK
jgi:hypothetical protein